MVEKQCQRGENTIFLFSERNDLINVLIVNILTKKSWSVGEKGNIVKEKGITRTKKVMKIVKGFSSELHIARSPFQPQ